MLLVRPGLYGKLAYDKWQEANDKWLEARDKWWKAIKPVPDYLWSILDKPA